MRLWFSNKMMLRTIPLLKLVCKPTLKKFVSQFLTLPFLFWSFVSPKTRKGDLHHGFIWKRVKILLLAILMRLFCARIFRYKIANIPI